MTIPISRAVRCALVPVAAIARFTAGLIAVSLGGTVLRRVLSEQELESILRLDVRLGLLGAAAAFGTVVAGSAMAPSARRLTSTVIFGLGSCAAWLLLGSWSFPERHPMAYQGSPLPLVLTCLGGVNRDGVGDLDRSAGNARPLALFSRTLCAMRI